MEPSQHAIEHIPSAVGRRKQPVDNTNGLRTVTGRNLDAAAEQLQALRHGFAIEPDLLEARLMLAPNST